MNRMYFTLLISAVLIISIPAMADEGGDTNINVNINGYNYIEGGASQSLINYGDQYNTNKGSVLGITASSSTAVAGVQIGAFDSVNNGGGNATGDSTVDGDVAGNGNNSANANSGSVTVNSSVGVYQTNIIWQHDEIDIDNNQALNQIVTITVNQDDS